MAILGSQIVITMIFASLLSKMGPFFSLGRLLLANSGLVRYLHPADEELRQLAKIPKEHKKGGKNNSKNAESNGDVFKVPRNLDVQLVTAPVTLLDLVQLRFYDEYQWLVDFAVHATLVYAVTELYVALLPDRAALDGVNLSMVWCLLVAGLAYRLLLSLSSLYFQAEESGERSLVVVMAAVYLLLAMLALVVDEDTLETGLDDAYSSFNASAAAFLADNAGLDSSGPASKLVLKFFLAVWCASIGALFTFPGLRLARMQWDVVQHTHGFAAVLHHLSFVSPLLLATLWIRPLGRDYLAGRTFKGMDAPFLTSAQFETLRIYLVLAALGLRLALMPRYLQSYLNVAYYKMEELKQEAGKISNVDLQRIVARVFYYLCVVTLQYVAPMVVVLALTLMYKTMGGGCWTGLWASEEQLMSPSVSAVSPANQPAAGDQEEQFSLAWQSLKQVFTPPVFRGLLGFSLWWCCLAWFTSSAIGITYQSYFANNV